MGLLPLLVAPPPSHARQRWPPQPSSPALRPPPLNLEIAYLRVCCHRWAGRPGQMVDVFYVVDVVAVLPLYIELISEAAFDHKPGLEPLRLTRVLKVARHYEGARVHCPVSTIV